MKLRQYTHLLVSTVALLYQPIFARAEYPDHPIRIIAPFPAGGVADTLSRIVGDRISQNLKQPFIVEIVRAAEA